MKKLLASLLFFTALCAPALAQTAPAPATAIPDVVASGFDAYKQAGATAAIDAWFKGTPLESDITMRANTATNLGKFESAYGKYIGWELIRVVSLSPSTRIVYAVAKFEKGTLWLSFNCYKAVDTWTIPTMDMNTSPEKVLPANMLSGQ